MLSGAPPTLPTSRNMYIDHTGTKYSISTDEEDRFDYLIKKIKVARNSGDYDSCSDYMNLLDQEFGHLIIPERIKEH